MSSPFLYPFCLPHTQEYGANISLLVIVFSFVLSFFACRCRFPSISAWPCRPALFPPFLKVLLQVSLPILSPLRYESGRAEFWVGSSGWGLHVSPLPCSAFPVHIRLSLYESHNSHPYQASCSNPYHISHQVHPAPMIPLRPAITVFLTQCQA